jgi:hypothetical protein
MTQEQQTLIAEIQRLFGDGCFDTISVIGRAAECPEFETVIEAAIPNCRWRSRERRQRCDGGLAVHLPRSTKKAHLLSAGICTPPCGRSRPDLAPPMPR